jgi:hypothetical protein
VAISTIRLAGRANIAHARRDLLNHLTPSPSTASDQLLRSRTQQNNAGAVKIAAVGILCGNSFLATFMTAALRFFIPHA